MRVDDVQRGNEIEDRPQTTARRAVRHLRADELGPLPPGPGLHPGRPGLRPPPGDHRHGLAIRKASRRVVDPHDHRPPELARDRSEMARRASGLGDDPGEAPDEACVVGGRGPSDEDGSFRHFALGLDPATKTAPIAIPARPRLPRPQAPGGRESLAGRSPRIPPPLSSGPASAPAQGPCLQDRHPMLVVDGPLDVERSPPSRCSSARPVRARIPAVSSSRDGASRSCSVRARPSCLRRHSRRAESASSSPRGRPSRGCRGRGCSHRGSTALDEHGPRPQTELAFMSPESGLPGSIVYRTPLARASTMAITSTPWAHRPRLDRDPFDPEPRAAHRRLRRFFGRRRVAHPRPR